MADALLTRRQPRPRTPICTFRAFMRHGESGANGCSGGKSRLSLPTQAPGLLRSHRTKPLLEAIPTFGRYRMPKQHGDMVLQSQSCL